MQENNDIDTQSSSPRPTGTPPNPPRSTKTKTPLIIGIIAAILIVGGIIATIILLQKPADNGIDDDKKPSRIDELNSRADELLEAEPYVDEEYDQLSIRFPKGWEKGFSLPGTHVLFENPEGTLITEGLGYRANIGFVYEPTEQSLDDYASQSLDNLPRVTTDFNLIKNEDTTIDDTPAKFWEYTYTRHDPDADIPLTIQRIVVKKNGTMYMITGASLTSEWDTYKDMIEVSLRSIKFRD